MRKTIFKTNQIAEEKWKKENRANPKTNQIKVGIAEKAFENAFEKLISEKGGYPMSEALYPVGMVPANEKEDEKLKTLQAEAEKSDLLLPCQYNRSTKTTKQATDDDLLLPCGF